MLQNRSIGWRWLYSVASIFLVINILSEIFFKQIILICFGEFFTFVHVYSLNHNFIMKFKSKTSSLENFMFVFCIPFFVNA